MGLQVNVVFEFPDITDPNSPAADEVVVRLTEAGAQWKAQQWHEGQKECAVWVEDPKAGEADAQEMVSDEARSFGPWHKIHGHG
jgi:hypothetical protein